MFFQLWLHQKLKFDSQILFKNPTTLDLYNANQNYLKGISPKMYLPHRSRNRGFVHPSWLFESLSFLLTFWCKAQKNMFLACCHAQKRNRYFYKPIKLCCFKTNYQTFTYKLTRISIRLEWYFTYESKGFGKSIWFTQLVEILFIQFSSSFSR